MLAAKPADEGQPLPAGSDTMLRQALGFLVSNGPLTHQDRWEEDSGGSPFTLGVTIYALVAGAAFLARAGGTSPLTASESAYVLALTDNWNERDRVLDVRHRQQPRHEVRNCRSLHPDRRASQRRSERCLGSARVRSHQEPTGGDIQQPAAMVVGMEFLYLARLGLRAATDQRLLDTITVVEGELGQTVAPGPVYHRYEDDGYGEANHGSPFTGSAVGRLWPAACGRARPLRSARGAKRDGPAHRAAADGRSRLAHPRAGLGCRRHRGRRFDGGTFHGLRDAARLGTLGVDQARPDALDRHPNELLGAVLSRYNKAAPVVTTAWYCATRSISTRPTQAASTLRDVAVTHHGRHVAAPSPILVLEWSARSHLPI
jgi:glycosyl hydrolase family 15